MDLKWLKNGFLSRFLFSVQFYSLDYKYLNGDVFSDTRAATLVELPILIKYKSQRRKNLRMYIISGLKPGIEVGAKNKDEAGKDILGLKAYDISFELGFRRKFAEYRDLKPTNSFMIKLKVYTFGGGNINSAKRLDRLWERVE